jgi:hypothetical protein
MLAKGYRRRYAATGETAQFDAYLFALRTEHRRRPTLVAKLDAAGR